MGKDRLEAFSDGVIAILITIKVLGLAAPASGDLAALRALLPHVLGYALSFVLLGIYWNNHHHLFQAVEQVDGRVLWANLHLLFWLSLVPFTTGWITSTGFAPLPVATYGLVFLLAAVAYYLLARPRWAASSGLRPGAGHGARLEGPRLAAHLPARRSAGLRQRRCLHGAQHAGCPGVAQPRPPHRDPGEGQGIRKRVA